MISPAVSITSPQNGSLSSITGSNGQDDIIPVHSIVDSYGLLHLRWNTP